MKLVRALAVMPASSRRALIDTAAQQPLKNKGGGDDPDFGGKDPTPNPVEDFLLEIRSQIIDVIYSLEEEISYVNDMQEIDAEAHSEGADDSSVDFGLAASPAYKESLLQLRLHCIVFRNTLAECFLKMGEVLESRNGLEHIDDVFKEIEISESLEKDNFMYNLTSQLKITFLSQLSELLTRAQLLQRRLKIIKSDEFKVDRIRFERIFTKLEPFVEIELRMQRLIGELYPWCYYMATKGRASFWDWSAVGGGDEMDKNFYGDSVDAHSAQQPLKNKKGGGDDPDYGGKNPTPNPVEEFLLEISIQINDAILSLEQEISYVNDNQKFYAKAHPDDSSVDVGLAASPAYKESLLLTHNSCTRFRNALNNSKRDMQMVVRKYANLLHIVLHIDDVFKEIEISQSFENDDFMFGLTGADKKEFLSGVSEILQWARALQRKLLKNIKSGRFRLRLKRIFTELEPFFNIELRMQRLIGELYPWCYYMATNGKASWAGWSAVGGGDERDKNYYGDSVGVVRPYGGDI